MTQAVAWPRWLILAAVAAAMMVLAHGCHGPDEDHELFTSWVLRF
jgi:hypothetical protein